MHAEFRCPCGAEFGTQTDHPAGPTEKLCEAHTGGSGYRGVVKADGSVVGAPPPEYPPGKGGPENFRDFVSQEAAKATPETAPANGNNGDEPADEELSEESGGDPDRVRVSRKRGEDHPPKKK